MSETIDKSEIKISDSCTVFSGADATALFAATTLKSAIELYRRTGIKASRAYTPANMLAAAARITKKTYKRGQLAQASADLQVWIDTMKAALPVVDERTKP